MSSNRKYKIEKVEDKGSGFSIREEDGEFILKIRNWDDPNFDPTTRTYIQYKNFDKNGELRIGGIIKKNKIVKKEEVINEHPVFGKIRKPEIINRKFSMVFQIERKPLFSKKVYKGYWSDLIYSVDKTTNAIYYMRGYHVVLATKTEQLAKICEATHRYYIPFHDELLVKRYMAEVIMHGCKYFIINPNFVRNGNPLTEIAYTLFDIK